MDTEARAYFIAEMGTGFAEKLFLGNFMSCREGYYPDSEEATAFKNAVKVLPDWVGDDNDLECLVHVINRMVYNSEQADKVASEICGGCTRRKGGRHYSGCPLGNQDCWAGKTSPPNFDILKFQPPDPWG